MLSLEGFCKKDKYSRYKNRFNIYVYIILKYIRLYRDL